MYDLYRFTTRSRAEEFLRGDLYLSPLGRFWPPYPKERDDSKDPDGRLDSFEGTVFAQRPEDCPLPAVFRDIMKTELHFVLDSNQYVNLLCMVQHPYNPIAGTMKRINPCMKEWGDSAIRIRNVENFIGRLMNYAKSQNDDYFLAGPVEYLDLFSKKPRNDCFNKSYRLSWQSEWRVVYLADLEGKKNLAKNWNFDMGAYDEPLRISIGSLDDIAEIIPSDSVFNNLEGLYEGLKVVRDDEFTPAQEPDMYISAQLHDGEYRGWRDRISFQNLVASIDGGGTHGRLAL